MKGNAKSKLSHRLWHRWPDEQVDLNIHSLEKSTTKLSGPLIKQITGLRCLKYTTKKHKSQALLPAPSSNVQNILLKSFQRIVLITALQTRTDNFVSCIT
jgi:hypothetical protein